MINLTCLTAGIDKYLTVKKARIFVQWYKCGTAHFSQGNT